MCPIPEGLCLSNEATGQMPCRVAHYLGRPFVYPAGSDVGAAIAQGWDWDGVLRTIINTLVPDDEPLICEVGSNIGASILEILSVRPRARASCFEPSDRYRAFLEYNLALAGFDRVRVFPYLVDRQAGTGAVHTDGTSGSIRPMPHLATVQEAKIVTLDEELAGRVGTMRFLKTDTDGNDLEVLRGAEGILREDQPVLFLEFCPALMQTDPVADLMWLQGLGYQRLLCLNHLGYLIGMTSDARQAVDWAKQHTYCDFLTCASGTAADGRLVDIGIPAVPNVARGSD